jgi:hypothetical protein
LKGRQAVGAKFTNDVEKRHGYKPLAALYEQPDRARRLVVQVVGADGVERAEYLVSGARLPAPHGKARGGFGGGRR